MNHNEQFITASTKMSLAQQIKLYQLETKYEWLKTIRNPAFALPAILFPALFYTFFGVVMNKGNHQAASYLLCTYGVFGVMGPALFSFGAGLAVERGQGWLEVKEASPMPESAQIVSRVLVSMVFSCLVLLTLGLVAAFFTDVSLSVNEIGFLSIILVIGGLPFCLLGLTLGLLLNAQSAAAIVNVIYLPMSFLSGLWIPITMLPDVLQSFAQFLPPYHLSQLALSVIGQDAGGNIGLYIGALVLFSVLFFLTSLWAFSKKS